MTTGTPRLAIGRAIERNLVLACVLLAAGAQIGCATSAPPANDAALRVQLFQEPALNVVAFGSCIAEDEPQPILDAVVASGPDLFVFLGDNVYADTEDMSAMRATYVRQSEQPGIRSLFSTTPVMATWDDHDYGRNDAGAEYPMKEEAQEEFLRFFAVPASSERRMRNGVYNSHTYGPPGKRVQVVLLDTRFFRSPLERWPDGARETIGPYRPGSDTTATMLGDAQWRWLADELREPADIRIIGSSIQVIAGEHGFESWANLPHERERLLRLIRETRAGGVVIVSGDRHLAEVSMMPADDALGVGYPLYDVTSSSLNRPSRGDGSEPNRYRVHPANYRPENFGTFEIEWLDDPIIRMQIRDMDGDIARESIVQLSDLQPPERPVP